MKGINPLWKIEPAKELEMLLENKFHAIIVGVAAHGLTEKHLGKEIDREFIKTLKQLHEKYKISMIGEGGEFESLVLDCPMFRKKIRVLETTVESEGERHFLIVKRAGMEGKNEIIRY